jgi:outer membrane protein
MLNLKKILLSIILLISFISYSYSENKVGYIDVDKILSNTISGKSLFEQFNVLKKTQLDQIENEGKKLKEEENKILSTKKIISQEEYMKKVNIFKEKILSFQKEKNNTIDNLNKKRNNEIIRFLKMVDPLIRLVMEENSIDILIEKKNIFIAKSNTDITDIVIEKTDKNIKSFKIEK